MSFFPEHWLLYTVSLSTSQHLFAHNTSVCVMCEPALIEYICCVCNNVWYSFKKADFKHKVML